MPLANVLTYLGYLDEFYFEVRKNLIYFLTYKNLMYQGEYLYEIIPDSFGQYITLSQNSSILYNLQIFFLKENNF